MVRSFRVFAVAVAVAGLTSVAHAQAPNLSGTWSLDAAKSDLGPMAQMMGGETPKITMVIDHKEPSVTMKTTTSTSRGERTAEQSLTTDGKEVTTTTPWGSATSSAKWDGKNLVITSKRTMQQGEVTQMQALVLSADGKILTIDGKAQTPMGDITMTQVFVKQ